MWDVKTSYATKLGDDFCWWEVGSQVWEVKNMTMGMTFV